MEGSVEGICWIWFFFFKYVSLYLSRLGRPVFLPALSLAGYKKGDLRSRGYIQYPVLLCLLLFHSPLSVLFSQRLSVSLWGVRSSTAKSGLKCCNSFCICKPIANACVCLSMFIFHHQRNHKY